MQEMNNHIYQNGHSGHILLVTFPAQGHINPSLQFANRLIKLGMQVTFATSNFAYRQMTKASAPPRGLNFAVLFFQMVMMTDSGGKTSMQNNT